MEQISVVVPARNEEQVLPACLAALRRQSVQASQLIVVDSASADRTGEVARSYGAEVVRVDSPGVARARQAGFARARGAIIASTDTDTRVPPDWLGRWQEVFRDREVVAAFGGIRYDGWLSLVSRLYPLVQLASFLLRRPMFPGANFAVRRDAFRQAGGFRLPDGSFPRGYPEAEDVRLGLKLSQLGRISFLPRACVITSARRLQELHGLLLSLRSLRTYLRLGFTEMGPTAVRPPACFHHRPIPARARPFPSAVSRLAL
ncbi:MAG: glycosyltransferase [Candidatus Bipolaricaulaceae bacterium]